MPHHFTPTCTPYPPPRFFIAAIGVLLVAWHTSAQSETYYALNARMEVRVVWNGKIVPFRSNKLAIALDYETTEMRLHLPVHSLHSGIDALDQALQTHAHPEIDFAGTLSLEYINTEKHPPQDFEFEGDLRWGDAHRLPIRGTGQLIHLNDQGQLACLFSVEAILSARSLGIEWAGLEDELRVIVTQALLEQDKN